MKSILKLTKAGEPSKGNPVYVNVDNICYLFSDTVHEKQTTYIVFEKLGIYVEERVEDILDLIKSSDSKTNLKNEKG